MTQRQARQSRHAAHRPTEVLIALSLSATCLAIALADERGTLTLTEQTDRWGDTYIAIGDERGTIEIADDLDAAHERVNDLRVRAAA